MAVWVRVPPPAPQLFEWLQIFRLPVPQDNPYQAFRKALTAASNSSGFSACNQ